MEEQLISFETAKLAKEKGFKELCFAAFHKTNRNDGYFESGIISQSEYFKFPTMSNGDKIAVLQKDYVHTILRPTQSLLQRWIREVHNIDITVMIRFQDTYGVILHKNRNIEGKEIIVDVTYENSKTGVYEEALEVGLQEALKLIN